MLPSACTLRVGCWAGQCLHPGQLSLSHRCPSGHTANLELLLPIRISHVCPSHQPGAATSLSPMGQTGTPGCWASAWRGLPGCLGNASASAPLPLFLFFDSLPGLFLLQTGDAPGFLAAFQVGELFYTQLKWRDVCIVPGKCKFLQKSYEWRRGFTTTDMEVGWPAAASSPSLVSEILFLAKKKEYIFQISL